MSIRKGKSISFEEMECLITPSEVSVNGGYTEVDVLALVAFKNHPFSVTDDEQMDDLVESIKEQGVVTPIIIRPEHREYGNKYEIISGHRRVHAAKRIGLRTIPAIVKDVDDDLATIMMVDANVQREEILLSEKVKALGMRYEAMKKQGQRKDLTSSKNETKLRADEELGELIGESRANIQRYLRLAKLISPLLAMLDAKKLSIATGVELSFFSEEIQSWLFSYIRTRGMLRQEQLVELRQYRNGRRLSQEKLFNILEQSKATPAKSRKITIYGNRLDLYFPSYLSKAEIERVIFKLLDDWKRKRRE